MNAVLKKIGEIGIVPVVKIENTADAVPLCRALFEGGLPLAEITFRTSAAEESIRSISQECPEVLVGAGTVLSVEQAEKAIGAGAKFIVSPGYNPKVVKYCLDNEVPVVPGCSSPTDIEMALEAGLDVVKFFPAEAFGGLKALKAISAPYGAVKFIPTGGIDETNLIDYLAFNKILACGGSWMVKEDLIRSKNFGEIERLTQNAVNRMLGFDLAHVGLNAQDAESSAQIAGRFERIFGLPVKEGNSSHFAGTIIEIMNGKGLGTNGHIAIKTNSIPRAIAYLERNGVEVDMSTGKKAADGSITAVYLKEEIGGFAVHLLQSRL